MRHLIAVVALALSACSLQAVGDGSTGSGGPSATSTAGGTTGSIASTTSRSRGGTTGGATSASSPAPGGGSGGGGSCGADSCPACPPASSCSADACVAGAWQCVCSCWDGGTTPNCGDVTCPVGCDLSTDCTQCIPQNATAGSGTPCATDLDCCTGTCVGGLCTSGVAGCQLSAQPNPSYDAACNPNGGTGEVCDSFGVCVPNCNDAPSACPTGTACEANGHCLSTPGCDPTGGSAFAGNWTGTTTATVTYSGGPASGGSGGGGGKESEVTVATYCGFEFTSYFSSVLDDCTVMWSAPSATSAYLVPGSCPDSSKGQWTFESGTATLDATGANLAVQTSGTLNDPTNGAGTFTTTSFLTRQ